MLWRRSLSFSVKQRSTACCFRFLRFLFLKVDVFSSGKDVTLAKGKKVRSKPPYRKPPGRRTPNGTCVNRNIHQGSCSSVLRAKSVPQQQYFVHTAVPIEEIACGNSFGSHPNKKKWRCSAFLPGISRTDDIAFVALPNLCRVSSDQSLLCLSRGRWINSGTRCAGYRRVGIQPTRNTLRKMASQGGIESLLMGTENHTRTTQNLYLFYIRLKYIQQYKTRL